MSDPWKFSGSLLWLWCPPFDVPKPGCNFPSCSLLSCASWNWVCDPLLGPDPLVEDLWSTKFHELLVRFTRTQSHFMDGEPTNNSFWADVVCPPLEHRHPVALHHLLSFSFPMLVLLPRCFMAVLCVVGIFFSLWSRLRKRTPFYWADIYCCAETNISHKFGLL